MVGALLLALLGRVAGAEVLLDETLGFDAPANAGESAPPGWFVAPAGSVVLDRGIVHAGHAAARLQRDASSDGEFSMVGRQLHQLPAGEWIELRGMLRTADVAHHAGLWLRQDAGSQTLQLDNMADRALRGTAEWQAVSIRQKLDPRTRSLAFGALLTGSGTLWADSLELLVDGKRVEHAPVRAPMTTVLDSDTEFVGGARIDLTRLSPRQVVDVAVLGKVWGFLKYHHPAAVRGERHWDFELFRVLPAVLAAPSSSRRNDVLSAWIDRLGEPPPCTPCAKAPADPHLDAPVAWITDQAVLGKRLAMQLLRIHKLRAGDADTFYVDFAPGVGNPQFEREPAYAQPPYPDAGFRLLAVLRLWNIVQYWFPYRDLVPGDWDQVLREFLPHAVAATDALAYQRVMIELAARIGDGHAAIWSASGARPPEGRCHLPIALRMIESEAVVVELGEDVAGVHRGDVLATIDGVPVATLFARWAPYYSASNAVAQQHALARAASRGACATSTLALLRDTKRIEVSVTRRPGPPLQHAHDRSGAVVQRLEGDIGYLTLSRVRAAEVPSYLDALQGTRGLVIDIRNYPSDFVVFALGKHLVTEPTPFARFTVAEADTPGVFAFTAPISLLPKAPHYAEPIAILVDESSMSQAEYTAMALRASPNAVIVGSPTAGADGNVSTYVLPGGLRAAISGIGVFYPDKRPTQRIGIQPDIVVRPSISGVREGRDEVLDAALAHLRSRIRPPTSSE